jgi:hypothetical protein
MPRRHSRHIDLWSQASAGTVSHHRKEGKAWHDCFGPLHGTHVPGQLHKGQGFAGHVAASLLNAADLPELITYITEEYEQNLALARENQE